MPHIYRITKSPEVGNNMLGLDYIKLDEVK